MTTEVRPISQAPPDTATPALQLRLLGGVSATWNGKKLAVSAPRMLGMLCYLHLHGPTPRSELIDIFWPGQGAQAVRQALYTLRGLPGASEWLTDGPEVGLHAQSDVLQARALLHEHQDAQALALLNSAGNLFGTLTIQGAPEFDEWQATERATLQNAHAAALKRQASAAADYGQARACLDQLLKLDPLDESTYRDLMRLEADAGHHAEMLEVFESLRETLHRELGIEPEPGTLALLHHLEGHEISGQNRARLLRAEHLSELCQDTSLKDNLCGREDDLDALQLLLKEKGRALVQGMAGMGKTRLAWAAAEQALKGETGVLWLELGGDPAEVLLPALAEPLGLRHVPPRQQPAPLHAALQERGVGLVVLDNAANSYALSVLLEYLPASLPVLVTSRLRLPRLPRQELHRLPRQASLELVGQHVQTLDPPPDSYTLDALCAILGDHPYALRLVAITLQKGQRSARELLQVLSDAPHALGAEHSVKTLLEQSLNNIDPASYEAYLGLGSLFTPQTTPELLALALRRPPDDVERALYTLLEHGLTTREAQPGSDRVSFRMHELTWHDAKAHAALQAKTVLLAVREYAEANTKAPENLYSELPNLIAAAQYAEKYEPQELVKVMSGWLGGQYIAARGFPVGYIRLLESAIDTASAQSDWKICGVLTVKLGDILQLLTGDLNKSAIAYLNSAQYAESEGDLISAANRLALAGGIQALNHADEYRITLERAKRIAEKSQDLLCLARVIEQEGIALAMKNEFYISSQRLEKAKSIIELLLSSEPDNASELQTRLIIVTSNLGQAKLALELFPEALDLKTEALQLARKRSDPLLIGMRMVDYAEALIAVERVNEAQNHLEEALTIFRDLGASSQESVARQMLGTLTMPT